MSAIPVIPLFPLLLWGVAKIIDYLITPWGTIVVGAAHAVFGVVLSGSIVRDLVVLSSEKRRARNAANRNP
jgi:hypothetical protein